MWSRNVSKTATAAYSVGDHCRWCTSLFSHCPLRVWLVIMELHAGFFHFTAATWNVSQVSFLQTQPLYHAVCRKNGVRKKRFYLLRTPSCSGIHINKYKVPLICSYCKWSYMSRLVNKNKGHIFHSSTWSLSEKSLKACYNWMQIRCK